MDFLLNPMVQIIVAIVLLIGYKFYSDIWLPLRPNRIRAILLLKDGTLHGSNPKIKVEGKQQSITIGAASFDIAPDCIYRQGLFRVPTAFYIAGKRKPIDLPNLKTADEHMTPEEQHDAIENHVIREAMRSFAGQRVSPDTALTLILLVSGGGLAVVWYMLNNKLEQILTALGQGGV